jgi:hypothetical protein
MTITQDTWQLRINAINKEKAAWLNQYESQLKLIQWVLVREFEEYTTEEDACIDCFIGNTEDAVAALGSIIADLRGRDFYDQARAKNPQFFEQPKAND